MAFTTPDFPNKVFESLEELEEYKKLREEYQEKLKQKGVPVKVRRVIKKKLYDIIYEAVRKVYENSNKQGSSS